MTGEFFPDPEEPLSRRERLRRVVLLGSSFLRNLAFHRAGAREPQHQLLHESRSHPHRAFWIEVHGNFFDLCVLEWCKLFADKRGQQIWTKVVTDVKGFESELLTIVNRTSHEFDFERDRMKTYRDKFVAHLDNDRVMHFPFLDFANQCVRFYLSYVIEREARPGDLTELLDSIENIEAGYQQCFSEAEAVYHHAISFVSTGRN